MDNVANFNHFKESSVIILCLNDSHADTIKMELISDRETSVFELVSA